MSVVFLKSEESHRAPLTKSALGQIANVSLHAARMAMESGGCAKNIRHTAQTIAAHLGAETLGIRVGYASISLSLGNGEDSKTWMLSVPHHGVNCRLNCTLRELVEEMAVHPMTAEEVSDRLSELETNTKRIPIWLVAPAVGLACASFGRLLGIDWLAFVPVFVGSALAQLMRYILRRNDTNIYASAAVVAFVGAILSGIGALLAQSATVNLAIVASILLLVPGIPAANAQTDIMDGYPTLGSARIVSVLMMLIFATAGLWLAKAVLGLGT